MLRPVGPRHRFFQPKFAAQGLAHQLGNSFGPPPLVLLRRELALDQNGVERHAIGGCEDLSPGNIGARGGTGPGNEGQEARMIGRINSDLGDGGESVRLNLRNHAFRCRRSDECGMLQLFRGIGSKPIGIVMAVDIGFLRSLAPARQPRRECRLRIGDALLARDSRMAAGQNRFGFGIKRSQQLALPAVPHARSHGANIGDGENEQQLQALHALHDGAKIEYGFEIVEVAHLRGFAHQQMMAD